MSRFKGNNELKNVLGAIPTKERIVESRNLPDYDAKNRQGLPAYKVEDELHLLAMLNTLKLEPQFYRSESETMKELRDLIEKIALKDPYLVAQMIVWSRCKGEGMKTINHLAATLLAPFISGQEWGKRFYSQWNKKEQKGGCIFRLDDMSEILGAFSSLNKSKLTNAMKKGFASVLENVDSYQILKYKKTAYDVMNLCHPNSKNSLATVKLESGEIVKTLDAIKKGLSISADTWESAQSEAGQIVAKAKKEGKITEEEAEIMLEKTKSDNWDQLLTEGKLGILAALRNIRSILKVCNDRKIIDKLCKLLSDEDAILKGKIMPYQIDTAYQILRDEFSGWRFKSKIELALLEGYESSIPNLKKALPGKTCVMIDCSGSMHAYCTSSGRSRINATAVEKAGLIAATIAKSCDCDIVRFGSTAEYAKYNSKKNVFELAEELSRANMGGTSINAAFNLITKDNKKYDRIIILSDNECNTRSRWGRGWTEQSYQEYIRKVASPYVYCIDFAAYGTVPLKNDGKVNYYFGYGYSMFNDISSKEFNPEAHLNEVKKIVI